MEGHTLLEEGIGVLEVCQMHAHGDRSMQVPPASIPSGLWDEGAIAMKTMALLQGVLPLKVYARHEDGMVEHVKNEHVELAAMGSANTDQLVAPPSLLMWCSGEHGGVC